MADNSLEFNLFTLGDSADITTWSNLPYFFSKALIKKEIKLNRINILPEESVLFKWHLIINKKWLYLKQRLFNKNFKYDPYRDKVIKYLIDRKIKCMVKKYAHVDLNIFLTFSFSSYKLIQIPVVHYCDQTYDLFLEDTNKKVLKRDRYFSKIERKNLENATHIFSTNPKCAKHIADRYKIKNITQLKGGINLDTFSIDKEHQILTLKKKHKDILFIGRGAYKRGVDILIEAFNQFNRLNANAFTLHLVGISAKSIAKTSNKIKCYGYLNKNSPDELKRYNDLLNRARLFVMPMRFGPRPGAVKEAGLMYTPVIITNIWHMDELIQNNINGLLVDRPDSNDFANQMHFLVNNEVIWEKLAIQAHKIAIKRYSWDHTIGCFLDICSSYLNAKSF